MVDGIEDTFTALHSDYADYDVSRLELSAMVQNKDVLRVAATEFYSFIVIVLAFNVMRKIAEDLTNPYGNDHTDYSPTTIC